jgi:hypothetical protein
MENLDQKCMFCFISKIASYIYIFFFWFFENNTTKNLYLPIQKKIWKVTLLNLGVITQLPYIHKIGCIPTASVLDSNPALAYEVFDLVKGNRKQRFCYEEFNWAPYHENRIYFAVLSAFK